MKSHRDEHISFPRGCRERWLPIHLPALQSLANGGVACSGVSNLTKNYSVWRRCPKTHLLLYTISGTGACWSNGRKIKLSRGSVLISPAGIEQHYCSHGCNWNILFYHLAARAPWDFETRNIVVRSGLMLQECLTCFEGILRHHLSETSIPTPLIEAFKTLLLASIEAEFTEMPASTVRGANSRIQAWRVKFNVLWENVGMRLNEPWTLKKMTDIIHVSPPHFRRLSRTIFGCSPRAMIARLRIQRASTLLCHTDLKVSDIADRVGYRNSFAFSSAFHRSTGLSPRQFRTGGMPGVLAI